MCRLLTTPDTRVGSMVAECLFILCKVKFLDYDGNEKILEAKGLLATCIQHEIDHLEGILFIDYLSKLKKTMIVKKLSKQKKSLERIVV